MVSFQIVFLTETYCKRREIKIDISSAWQSFNSTHILSVDHSSTDWDIYQTGKRKEKLYIIDPWYHPIASLKTFLIVYDHSPHQSMWPSDVSWILIFNRRKYYWKVSTNITFISYLNMIYINMWIKRCNDCKIQILTFSSQCYI